MRIIPLLLLTGLLVGLLGCSAPQRTASTAGGSLVLKITWPTTRAARGIPVNTQGVRLQVFAGATTGSAVARRWVARQAGTTGTTVTLLGVPFGQVTLMIEAFDTPDETAATTDLGTHRLAVGTSTVVVQQNGPTTASVTLVPSNFTEVPYAVSRPVNGLRHIVMGRVGTADINLTANLGQACTSPAFMPDGSEIAFVRDGNSIWMKTPVASHDTLRAVVPSSEDFTNIHHLVFSPCGGIIVFIADYIESDTPLLMAVDVATGSLRNLDLPNEPVAVTWGHPVAGRFELLVVTKMTESTLTQYDLGHFSAAYYESEPAQPAPLFHTQNQPITAVAYNDETGQVACAISGALFVGTLNKGATPAVSPIAGYPSVSGVQSVAWLPYGTGVGVCAALNEAAATSGIICQPNANPALLSSAQALGDLDITLPTAGGAHVVVQ
jgi:hypothetical protein